MLGSICFSRPCSYNAYPECVNYTVGDSEECLHNYKPDDHADPPVALHILEICLYGTFDRQTTGSCQVALSLIHAYSAYQQGSIPGRSFHLNSDSIVIRFDFQMGFEKDPLVLKNCSETKGGRPVSVDLLVSSSSVSGSPSFTSHGCTPGQACQQTQESYIVHNVCDNVHNQQVMAWISSKGESCCRYQSNYITVQRRQSATPNWIAYSNTLHYITLITFDDFVYSQDDHD